MIYHVLDILIVVFHSSLIVFNLFGWVWEKTRLINLITLTLTGSSWLFLGLIVGTLGYCPLTDWHFNILNKLGITNLPDSYVKYLTDRITGLDISASLIDKVTLLTFVAAFVLSLFVNIKGFVKLKKSDSDK